MMTYSVLFLTNQLSRRNEHYSDYSMLAFFLFDGGLYAFNMERDRVAVDGQHNS